jgi:hypothetical protein
MFVLNGCITSTTPAPLPKTTLKGKVVVPEGAVKGKQVTGEALAEATVNIVDPKTDNVIATTTTDVNGNYNVDITAGGPYIVEAGKGNVKVLDVSPIIQEGETKDLGTADATSTAQALIFMYLVEAGSDPSQIDIDAIPNLSGFSQLVNQIETILEAGGDPTTNTQVNNVINNIVSPQPATGGGGGGTPTPTPTPTPLPEKSTYQITCTGLQNEYPIGDLVVVSSDQMEIKTAVEEKIKNLTPIKVTLSTKVKGKSGYEAVRIQPVNAGSHIQLWAQDTSNNWYDINAIGWGDLGGFELPAEYTATTDVYLFADVAGEYSLNIKLVDLKSSSAVIAEASGKVKVELEKPVVTFKFDGFDSFKADTENDFKITTTAKNIDKAIKLRYKATLKNGVEPVDGQIISYKEGDSWKDFLTDASGVAYFGPSTGFTVEQLDLAKGVTTDFKATVANAGEYTLTLELINVDTSATIGASTEKTFSVAEPDPIIPLLK